MNDTIPYGDASPRLDPEVAHALERMGTAPYRDLAIRPEHAETAAALRRTARFMEEGFAGEPFQSRS